MSTPSALDKFLQQFSDLDLPLVSVSSALGLALLLLILRFFGSPSNSKAQSGSTSSSKGPQTPSSKVRVASIDAARLKAPNFGYDDVCVSKLLIHPIKSCRGLSVESARYTPEGLENDRLWCIVDAETHAAITAREISKMVLITPQLRVDDKSPDGGVLNVSFPADSECPPFDIPLRPSEATLGSWKSIEVALWGSSIDSRICEAVSTNTNASTILSQYCGRSVHLVFKGPRPRVCGPTEMFPDLQASTIYQDGYPLLFLSEENMGVIEDETRVQVGQAGVEERWRTDRVMVERFRPNIVLRGGGAFAEDLWEEIGICPRDSDATNAPSFLVVSKCTRCLLPNVSPDTGVRDKAVPYKVLMKVRVGVDPKNKWKACVGCNGVPLGSGTVSVGDRVVVKRLLSSLAGAGAP